MLQQTFAIIAPTFLCALVGYGWKKFNKPFDSDMVTLLIMNVGAPCLIVSTLSKLDLNKNLIVDFGTYVLLAILFTALASVFILKIGRYSLRNFSVPLIFGNHGNMGLPLCLFAFGEKGLALAVIYFTVVSFFHYSFGLAILSGNFSPLNLLRSPIILSTILAFYLIISGTEMPLWVNNTLELMGGMTIPLMLLALGVSLANIQVHNFHRNFMLACSRVLIGFCVGLLIAEIFDLQGVVRGVVILQSAMPSAIFNYLMAERYSRAASDTAGIVVLSTLISFASLPLLIPFVL